MNVLLLRAFVTSPYVPINETPEHCLTPVQLALQRMMQDRFDEVCRLHPCTLAYRAKGIGACETEENATDIEAQEAYALLRELDDYGALAPHKLAICCETLGKTDEARAASDRMQQELSHVKETDCGLTQLCCAGGWRTRNTCTGRRMVKP